MSEYPSVVDRYYTKYFFKSSQFHWMGPNEDLCILAHSNRICLVTLAPNHKALTEGPIRSVDYDIDGKSLAHENKASGKKKLQALKVYPHKAICNVVSGNGNKYIIKSAIHGKLLEINENLLKDPTLLNKMPETNGYIVVLLHKFCPNDKMCSNLLTYDQYMNPETCVNPEVGDKDANGIAKEEIIDEGKDNIS